MKKWLINFRVISVGPVLEDSHIPYFKTPFFLYRGYFEIGELALVCIKRLHFKRTSWSFLALDTHLVKIYTNMIHIIYLISKYLVFFVWLCSINLQLKTQVIGCDIIVCPGLFATFWQMHKQILWDVSSKANYVSIDFSENKIHSKGYALILLQIQEWE